MLNLKGATPKPVNVLNKNSNNGKTKEVARKPLEKCAKDGKSSSAGAISYTKPSVAKPKKTTQSDLCFNNKNVPKRTQLDYCKKCGDVVEGTTIQPDPKNVRTVQRGEKSGDGEGVITVESKENRTSTKSSSNSPQSSSSSRGVLSDRKSGTTMTSKTLINRPKSIVSKTSASKVASTSKSKSKHLREYYKNENYGKTNRNEQEIGKRLKNVNHLDPIKEISEVTVSDEDTSDLNSLYEILPNCLHDDEGVAIANSDNYDSLLQLRDFRKENYFECHSADSRLASKASTTSLGDHKCVYRFYLNDRLFPEPLNADHSNTIRCTKCLLPLNLDESKHTKQLNGTIQAKVKLGSDDNPQDMILMLPVKEPLIIKEKRKENKPKKEEEVVYFGVIKLNSYGYSKFIRTLPMDSLALKYQKGYKETVTQPADHQYKERDDFEVIVI